MLKTKLDSTGRLLLTSEEMQKLKFIPGETVCLDLSNKGIEISNSFHYSLTYDRIRVMPNGVMIGRDICRSKLLMTDARMIENKGNEVDIKLYSVEYYIEDKKIIVPLSAEQADKDIRLLRIVDASGQVLIPHYLQKLYKISNETGIEIQGQNIVISNDFEQKTIINELGLLTIPQNIIKSFDIKPKTELEIVACANILLCKQKQPGVGQFQQR